ncbi:nitroreductase/quinone reductase family protein [Mycobacterium arosiense]|uniref:Nitroreductase n=1 Tax=Mycobacterium arosiense ATCC BAA-1401 = DSM 45069 TaxID=1265311 RepID=A0A1W9ZPD0_MYCAI|nr:nitroreductase/quinone reductase family protein [Mycobacterium arosiense]ORA19475.1 nitroreductase [Mycobacterium arosiense ATCC BAA-1401 = DSM 45069]
MSDETAAAIRADRHDWVARHREMYLMSAGKHGHIMDLTDTGGRALTAHCLLRTKGRRSGQVYVNALIYGIVAGEVVVVASKGGADRHPDWYLNVREMYDLEFQIATQAFRASWREPEGTERKTIWNFMVGVYPPYASYQASTVREIPLVMMQALEPVEVFGAIGDSASEPSGCH